MTRLTRSSASSVGDPHRFGKLSWADFVQYVLELTVAAYLAMRQEHVAQRDWEENVFTLHLGENYLRNVAFDNEFSIRVQVRQKIHTPQMKAGQQATLEAQEIDMSMYGVWERDYHQRHFVWEAKKVGDKRVNQNYSRLNSEYVNEGIYRFIRGEYAGNLDDAGMLGYVLAGSVPNIVNDINGCMGNIRKNPPLPQADHLRKAVPVSGFEDIYRSSHTRTDHSHIRLHHLFLVFEF